MLYLLEAVLYSDCREQINVIAIASPTASAITVAKGNKVELRRTGANANHSLTTYYGFHSMGGAGGSGNISGTDWRHAYYENFPNFGGTINAVTGLWIDRQTRGTNNYGIVLNGDGAGADIVFGTTQAAKIYANAGELFAKDALGNVTQISPHDPQTGNGYITPRILKLGK